MSTPDQQQSSSGYNTNEQHDEQGKRIRIPVSSSSPSDHDANHGGDDTQQNRKATNIDNDQLQQHGGDDAPESAVKSAASPPKMDNPDLQAMVNKVWPALMTEVEKKSTSMEQDLIKRHNIRMMNEMQEVVRQIKIAKVRNDEVLRAYHAKHGELTRAVTDVVEKQQSLSNDLEDVKRKMAQLKQELTLRCEGEI
ncbi:hypothetical protein FOZ63_009874 [Perkinsus olseni]|uniref:Uncharacterized protein n=1 Tax=Perkinsus olseni TaxID=32597 RepID=A0A7J6QD55_PEROL|nr:hypothetical protein FOZ63_009874 [Perkinsus olseni]